VDCTPPTAEVELGTTGHACPNRPSLIWIRGLRAAHRILGRLLNQLDEIPGTETTAPANQWTGGIPQGAADILSAIGAARVVAPGFPAAAVADILSSPALFPIYQEPLEKAGVAVTGRSGPRVKRVRSTSGLFVYMPTAHPLLLGSPAWTPEAGEQVLLAWSEAEREQRTLVDTGRPYGVVMPLAACLPYLRRSPSPDPVG
jgi:hypothetical protein